MVCLTHWYNTCHSKKEIKMNNKKAWFLKLWYRESNSGPSTCQVGTLPLGYIPSLKAWISENYGTIICEQNKRVHGTSSQPLIASCKIKRRLSLPHGFGKSSLYIKTIIWVNTFFWLIEYILRHMFMYVYIY